MTGIGRTLVVLGLIVAAAGLVLIVAERLGIRVGRLPGDIVVRGRNGVFYFPLVTCLLLSLLGSLVLWLLGKR